jgi:hypothetical protein
MAQREGLPMNADISVAPEIAQLEQGHSWLPVPQPAVPGTGSPGTASPVTVSPASAPTVGALSRELTRLAATPQRWWDLVRFDPDRPVRISLPAGPRHEAWLLVMPPGAAGECRCGLATLIAGEAAEEAAVPGAPGTAAPLRPGRVLVHGTPRGHAIRSAGHGYSVTLHVGAARSVRN